MARISGVELQDNWRVDFALTRIKGIGWSLAEKVLAELQMNPSKRVSDLTGEDLSTLASKVEEYPIEGDLARKVRGDIQRLRDISSYRGMRHSRGLPARGQRTRTNARTKRGKRKTVGAFKKEMLTKMTANKKEEEKK
ncbi:MAG TPA: 30S ribosomal protein S13 [Patescibacteria group bacterium]